MFANVILTSLATAVGAIESFVKDFLRSMTNDSNDSRAIETLSVIVEY